MADTHCKRSKYELILRSFNKDVEAALCCKSQNPISLFEKDKLENVKKDLDNGIKNEHCCVCWHTEEKGELSWRQIGNSIEMFGKSIEIYFDNICDQACIYCSPKYSSKWFQELKHVPDEYREFLNNNINDNTFNHTPKQNHKTAIMNEIALAGKESQSHEVVAIILLGGEPLLSPQFTKTNILEEIVETFYKHANIETRLRVTMITNANTPDSIIDKTLDICKNLHKKYSKLKITAQLSIESTNKNAEFVRYGLDYSQFEKNLHKYLASDLKIGFSMAVNTVSFADTPNFLRKIFELSKDYNKKIFFNFNLVYYPQFLCIKTLPKDYNYILKECRTIFNFNKDNFVEDSFYFRTLTQLDHAEILLGSDINDKHIKNVKNYFIYITKNRKKDISDLNLPYYRNIINE